MVRNIYLMCKDTPVLEYNVDDGIYKVLNEALLPYPLKDKFLDVQDKKYERLSRVAFARLINKNNEIFNNWLRLRLLPIDRANAKRIVLALGQDPVPQLKLVYIYHGLSVIDNYWLTVNRNIKWQNMNVREVSLSESIALVALHGTSVTLQGKIITPEVTNQGAYAKAWLRRDGRFWLYKKGAVDSTESRIEAMVSNLLDKTNVRHVFYEMAEEPDPDGVESPTCCRCPCIADDSNMILPAMDYLAYCNSHDLNFDRECERIDPDLYYKMMIVDYLIANRDRHLMNWGFYVDGTDNRIKCLHPLFDHNNAFDIAYMNNGDLGYQALNGVTMRAAATHAMGKVDFHFTAPIVREDFITERQYNCFMSRAEELGIRTDLSDKMNWCRENAPDAYKNESNEFIEQMMHDAWISYLRNDYGKPRR